MTTVGPSDDLSLPDPTRAADQIVAFIKRTFTEQDKHTAVIGVSGGIDSATSLTLACRALGPAQVVAVTMPDGDQPTADAQSVLEFNAVSAAHRLTINIKPMVDSTVRQLPDPPDRYRRGNIAARCRMMVLYDTALARRALVCGTENKSEYYLGYFTRYGDEASDLEPIVHLWKTQVSLLAEHLGLPERIRAKPPSADLWTNQTDQQELGFSYRQADPILAALERYLNDNQLDTRQLAEGPAVRQAFIDHWQGKSRQQGQPERKQPGPDRPSTALVSSVVARIAAQDFKHRVPYRLTAADDD
ncbi:MAG: NAD(+) synthase [Candidatus Pacebacteria bacterium CG10_big_fil_rev_8_21_14_0_10_56_10]|nr:MAG: NAD(+) synthase [Candidatus Pacebacteria bacterium CG10_big_fil_rev_8_21_14_0_10_56_10]